MFYPNRKKKQEAKGVSAIVEFLVVVVIMAACVRTLVRRRAGAAAASMATPQHQQAPSYNVMGYKTHTLLLGFHLLTRLVFVLAVIRAFVASEYVSVLATLLFIAAIHISPVLVLAGVAYHWSIEPIGDGFERVNDHPDQSEPAGIQLT